MTEYENNGKLYILLAFFGVLVSIAVLVGLGY
jgi:hypothetical protein